MLSFLQSAASSATTPLTFFDFLIALMASLALGICVSALYMFKNTYSKSFVVTLALLPAMVQMVIMLVNGNLGAGVAVMGAFSLVRFRSIPGTAREIGSIFFAMAIGLATGMGYVAIATLFLIIVGLATLILQASHFGESASAKRLLKISVPENLDYEGLFEDVIAAFTQKYELVQVKTTNMGSLFELHYLIECRGETVEKSFLDAIRVRNGNLSVSCSKLNPTGSEL